jgi:hypothetical protein
MNRSIVMVFPVSEIEELRFQPAEEAFAGGIVLRASFAGH